MKAKINWKELRRKIFIVIFISLTLGLILYAANYYLFAVLDHNRYYRYYYRYSLVAGDISFALLFGVIAGLAYRNSKIGIIVFAACLVQVIYRLFLLPVYSPGLGRVVLGLLVGFAVGFEKKLDLKLLITSLSGFLAALTGFYLAEWGFQLFYLLGGLIYKIESISVVILTTIYFLIFALTVWTFIWLSEEIYRVRFEVKNTEKIVEKNKNKTKDWRSLVVLTIISIVIVFIAFISISTVLKVQKHKKKFKSYDKQLSSAKDYTIFAYLKKDGFFKISGNGSNKKKILDKAPTDFLISPDRTYAIMSTYTDGGDYKQIVLYIYNLKTEKINKFYNTVDKGADGVETHWLPNNKLVLIDYVNPKQFYIYTLPSLKKEVHVFDKPIAYIFNDYPRHFVSRDAKFLIFNQLIKEHDNYEDVKTIAYDIKKKMIVEQSKEYKDYGEDSDIVNPIYNNLVDKYNAKSFDLEFEEQKLPRKIRLSDQDYLLKNRPLRLKARNKETVIFDNSHYDSGWNNDSFFLSKDNSFLIFRDYYDPSFLNNPYDEYIYLVDIKTRRISRVCKVRSITGIIKTN